MLKCTRCEESEVKCKLFSVLIMRAVITAKLPDILFVIQR